MSRPTRLTSEEVGQRLGELPGWSQLENALLGMFTFKDFSEAWAFMCRCALAAEKLDHHPDWSNVYNCVTVKLNTHDQGGITDLDFQLAKQIDSYYRK